MTKEQAIALVQRVQRETPQIQVAFDESRARNERGYRVRLQLAGRVLDVNYFYQWEGIKDAWQWFLPPEQIDVMTESEA